LRDRRNRGQEPSRPPRSRLSRPSPFLPFVPDADRRDRHEHDGGEVHGKGHPEPQPIKNPRGGLGIPGIIGDRHDRALVIGIGI